MEGIFFYHLLQCESDKPCHNSRSFDSGRMVGNGDIGNLLASTSPSPVTRPLSEPNDEKLT